MKCADECVAMLQICIRLVVMVVMRSLTVCVGVTEIAWYGCYEKPYCVCWSDRNSLVWLL